MVGKMAHTMLADARKLPVAYDTWRCDLPEVERVYALLRAAGMGQLAVL